MFPGDGPEVLDQVPGPVPRRREKVSRSVCIRAAISFQIRLRAA